jgi:hypothetical protein
MAQIIPGIEGKFCRINLENEIFPRISEKSH